MRLIEVRTPLSRLLFLNDHRPVLALTVKAGTTAMNQVLNGPEIYESYPVLDRSSGDAAGLILSAEVLSSKSGRRPDFEKENAALFSLMRSLAESPSTILHHLVTAILDLTNAQSAGISFLNHDRSRFFWPAVAGEWSRHEGGGTPRDFGPCGTVLDRDAPLLFRRPQNLFPYLADAKPALEDALLFPFYVEGVAVGTIWAVTHDASVQFDGEDLRVMGNLADFASAVHQSVKAREVGEFANETQQRLASIIENSDDAIISKNLDGIITSCNGGAERLFGYSADEIIGKSVTVLIPPENIDEEPRILEKIKAGERINHYETVRRRKDGTLVPISLSVSPIKDTRGRVVGASKIARDITERKHADEVRDLLLAEMKHRIKNNLAMIQSLASQTFRLAPLEEREAFAARLLALARSHDLLATKNWVKTSVEIVVTQALSPFRERGSERCRVAGTSGWIDASTAMMLGLAIHELATNAIKYGALSNDAGTLAITWTRLPERCSHPPALAFCWEENGGPPVRRPSRSGFGTALIQSAFGSEPVEFDYRNEGFVCRFCVPIIGEAA